jgi:hypothetical protein
LSALIKRASTDLDPHVDVVTGHLVLVVAADVELAASGRARVNSTTQTADQLVATEPPERTRLRTLPSYADPRMPAMAPLLGASRMEPNGWRILVRSRTTVAIGGRAGGRSEGRHHMLELVK